MNSDETPPVFEYIFKKGQNPIFDDKITKTFQYTILLSLFFSISMALMPADTLKSIYFDKIFKFAMSSTNFFNDKYAALEYAKTDLGFKYVSIVSIIIIVSFIRTIYTLYVVVMYWASENNEWNKNYHYSILFSALFLFLVFYYVFLADSNLRGVKYPGTLTLLNSEFAIVFASVAVVLMSSFLPAFAAYILKLIKYKG